MSCARSASSATVSRMSAPRWPGDRRGAAVASDASVGAGVPGEEAGAGLSAISLNLRDGLSFAVQVVSVVVGHGWARYLRAAGGLTAEVYDSPAATQAGLESFETAASSCSARQK